MLQKAISMQLHSNYINFSACVIDNASDPGVTAKNIWIDVVTVREQLCLSFMDNGSGMTPNKLHKMLRCVKTDTNDALSCWGETLCEEESLIFFTALDSQRKAPVKAVISPSAYTEMGLSRVPCVLAAMLWSSQKMVAVRAWACCLKASYRALKLRLWSYPSPRSTNRLISFCSVEIRVFQLKTWTFFLFD